MIRTSLINGVINLDSDFSKYIESLSNPGVIEGFNVQDGVVKPGKARVKAERTNGETIYCYVENTEDVSLSGNDGKVYIVIDQEDIDSGLVSEDGSNIARIEEGEVRPEKNFLKIWSKNGGIIKDEREIIKKIQDIDSEAQEQIDSLDERMTDAEDEIEEIKSTSIENIGNLVVDGYFVDDVQKGDIVNFYYNKKLADWTNYHTAGYSERSPYLYYFSKNSDRKYNISVKCWGSGSSSSFSGNCRLYNIDNGKPGLQIGDGFLPSYGTSVDKTMKSFMLGEYNNVTGSGSSSGYNSTYLFKFTPTNPTKIESLTKTTGVILYDEDMQEISSLNGTILEQGESFYVRYPKNTSNTRYIANSSITNFNIESYKCLTEGDIFGSRSNNYSSSRITDDITFVARRTFTVSDFYSYSTSYGACSVELSDGTTFVLTGEYTFEEGETYILHMSDLYQRKAEPSAIDDRQEFMNITSTKKDNAYRVFKIKSYEGEEIRTQESLTNFYGISLFQTCTGLVFQNALIDFGSNSSSYSGRIGYNDTNGMPFIKNDSFENNGFGQTDGLNAIFMKRRQVYDPNQQVGEIYIAKNNYSAGEVGKCIKAGMVDLGLDFDGEAFIGKDGELNPTENAGGICLGINNSEAGLVLNPYLVTKDSVSIINKTNQVDLTTSSPTTDYCTFNITVPGYYSLTQETRYYIRVTVLDPDNEILYYEDGDSSSNTKTTTKYFWLDEGTYTVKITPTNTGNTSYTRSVFKYSVTFQNAFMDQN